MTINSFDIAPELSDNSNFIETNLVTAMFNNCVQLAPTSCNRGLSTHNRGDTANFCLNNEGYGDLVAHPQGWMSGEIGMDSDTLSLVSKLVDSLGAIASKMPDGSKLSEAQIRGLVSSGTDDIKTVFKDLTNDVTSEIRFMVLALAFLMTGHLAIQKKSLAYLSTFTIVSVLLAAETNIGQNFYSNIVSGIHNMCTKSKRKSHREIALHSFSDDTTPDIPYVEKVTVEDELDDDEDFSPQALEENDWMISLVRGIFHVFSFKYLREVPSGKFFDELSKKLGNFKRTNEGIGEIIKWAKDVIDSIVTYIRVHILGQEQYALLHGLDPEVEVWCKEVEKYVDLQRKHLLTIDRNTGDKIYYLVQKGRELTLTDRPHNKAAKVANAIRVYYDTVREIARVFERANVYGMGPRMEPYVILLRGGTATGKSWLTIPFLIDLLCRVLPADELEHLKNDYKSFIYSRQQEHKYWDGYQGQFVTIFDDLGQVRDVVGNGENEWMDLIRAANLFQNVCHMASLDQKGSTVFASKIIFCTTNDLNFQINSLTCPNAVKRRFDLIVDVTIDDKYCIKDPTSGKSVGRIDSSLFPNGDFQRCVYKFGKYDMDLNGHTTTLDYNGLLDLAVGEFKKKRSKNTLYLNQLDSQIGNYLQSNAAIPQAYTPNAVGSASYDVGVDREESFIPPDHFARDLGTFNDTEAIWSERECLVRALHDQHEFYNEVTDERIAAESGLPISFVPRIRLFARAFMSVTVKRDTFCEACQNAPDDGGVGKCADWCEYKNFPRPLWGAYELSTSNFFYGMATKLSKGALLEFDMLDTLGYRMIAFYKKTRVTTAICLRSSLQKLLRFNNAKEILHSLSSTLYLKIDTYLSARPMLKRFMQVSIIVGGILALVATSYKIYRMLNDKSDDFSVIVEDVAGDNTPSQFDDVDAATANFASGEKGRMHNQHRVRRDLKFHRPPAQPEAFLDVNSVEIGDRILNRSCYSLFLPGFNVKPIGTVIFVRDRIGVLPRHYVEILDDYMTKNSLTEDYKFRLESFIGNISYEVPASCILKSLQTCYMDSVDIVIFQASKNVHCHLDIVKLFVSEDSLNIDFDINVTIATRRNGTIEKIIVPGDFIMDKKVVSTNDTWNIARAIKYIAGTRPGDCGSPVLLNNKAVGPGKILGVHVAGNCVGAGYGIAAILTKENLEEAIRDIAERDGLVIRMELAPQALVGDSDEVPYVGNFVPMGKLNKPVNVASRTKLIKSTLHGAWKQSTKKPAHLREFVSKSGHIINPWDNALSKYCLSTCDQPVEKFRMCLRRYMSDLMVLREPGSKLLRTYNFEEAVIGIPGLDFVKAIPRNTSAGFPYVLDPKLGFSGKQWFFGKEVSYDLTREQAQSLKTEVHDILSDAAKGIRRAHIFVDGLKDETRPNAKVDIGKTRLISASPLAYLIAVRMMFLDFSRYMMTNAIHSCSAVGINPYSDQWTELALFLSEKGPHVFAGDFSSFDGSQPSSFLYEIGEAIIGFMGGTLEDARIRRVLWMDVYNSLHVSKDIVYGWTGSLPSGHPLTTIINTIMVNTLMMLAWGDTMGFSDQSMCDFRHYVNPIAYGDDNVVNVAEDVHLAYNAVSVSEVLLRYGFTYTSESKEAHDEKTTVLSNIKFLKRAFVLDKPNRTYLCPLDLETVLEIPFWTKRCANMRKQEISAVKDTIDELSLHTKEVWDAWAPKIFKGSRDSLNHFFIDDDQFSIRDTVRKKKMYW